MSLRRTNLALFCSQFASSLMQIIFLFYYVKVFLNIFHVNERWFNIAQVLFMFWNAINDPLFGYIQDVGDSWMKNRYKIFTYIGPFVSISFLILWFPWNYSMKKNALLDSNYMEGIHLIVALFLYDAFSSCISVAWGALFTESTRCHSERVKGLKYSQLAILASCIIFILIEKCSHSLDDFYIFQAICVGISILSTLCFFITGKFGNVPNHLSSDHSVKKELICADEEPIEQDLFKSKISWSNIFQLTKELFLANDFLRIVLTNFIHTSRSIMHLNFASITVDLLIPQSMLPKGSLQLGLFFTICTTLPQILIIINERLLVRWGAYSLFKWSFALSIFSSIVMFHLSENPIAIMIFLVIDSISVHATAPLFNILLAEFVKDDALRNKRRRALSSMVFSLSSLIVKPAVSIAPMVVLFFLNRSGYKLYQTDNIRSNSLKTCLLRVTFGSPVILSMLEYLTLRDYTLHSIHKIQCLDV